MPAQPDPEIPANAIRHPKCGRWWTGQTISHCAKCCRTFSGTSAFDLHWKGTENGKCRDPEDVGLVAVPQKYGDLWSWPPGDFHPARRDAD